MPASGYYEWQARPDGKQPYYITSRDGSLLAFAGLWETWHPKEGEPVTSFTIIVCAPNPLAAKTHDRMPVILAPLDWNRWLMGEAIAELLKPCPEELLKCYPVSRAVNSPKNDGPELLECLPEADIH